MKKINIVGPSHIVRLENTYTHDSLVLPSEVTFIGKGGLPVWHDILSKLPVKASDKNLIVVGDFRLGNGYIDTGLKSDITGINKHSIKPSVDNKCYRYTIESLSKYEKDWDVQPVYIFWSLAVREAKNKIKRNYFCENGFYRHPVWNLKEVEAKFNSTFSLADLSPRQLISMCIDESNHPSFLGYVFLSKLINYLYLGAENLRALDLYKESYNYIHSNFVYEGATPNILGKTILQRFFKLAQYDGILNEGINDPININELPAAIEKYKGENIYISNIRYHEDFPRFCKDIDSIKEIITECNHGQLKIVFWDIYARCVFDSRHNKNVDSTYMHLYKLLWSNFSNYMLDLPSPNTFESFSLVELNKAGQPTYKMLCYLVDNSNSYDSFSNNFKKKIELMVEE
ncbi:hypothetical protein [Cobetia crustatorum]|uniref:hypothetical protein n=1 Tax=Cobetia crustatorum TaxID=553385 RepID=UPI0004B8061B|nr:hypothetical protein [Cobetia crustatorum]